MIDVEAAGCNFFDILLVQGKYQMKPPFPFTPGAEVAGVVRELGSGVRGVKVGDRVFAGVPLGAFAERIALPASALHPMPDGMTFPEGAAFPVVYPTSYAALVYRANLKRGRDPARARGGGRGRRRGGADRQGARRARDRDRGRRREARGRAPRGRGRGDRLLARATGSRR